jgi:hypothetical protein
MSSESDNFLKRIFLKDRSSSTSGGGPQRGKGKLMMESNENKDVSEKESKPTIPQGIRSAGRRNTKTSDGSNERILNDGLCLYKKPGSSLSCKHPRIGPMFCSYHGY